MPRSYTSETEALSGMDIAQDILECNKTLASEYTKASLESANPNIRRTFRQMGRDAERVAYRAFEILHERGHYEVKAAPQNECQKVEEMLESFQRGYAVPNAQGAASSPSGRWARTSERYGYDRPTYASERTNYAQERTDRSELPEWARART